MAPRFIASALALTVLAALCFLMGCRQPNADDRATPTPAGASVEIFFAGADEIIGLDGPVAVDFVDAEYRQLRRRDAIAPIYDPHLIPGVDATLPDDEMVIGVSVNGEAKAYPAGILYTREMVNDTVGGLPVLVTWCPLCYTALVHDRRVGAAVFTFGNQGALYKGAMTWYDHDTGSVWSQPTGEAISGAAVGSRLLLIPSQLTTWTRWRAAHPHTLALRLDSSSQPYRGTLPGDQHVVGVVVNGHAAAWPYQEVARHGPIFETVGGIQIRLWEDDETGAFRAAPTHASGGEIPAIIAYRWAWLKLYPVDSLQSVNNAH